LRVGLVRPAHNEFIDAAQHVCHLDAIDAGPDPAGGGQGA
jgi:hypothetical protein